MELLERDAFAGELAHLLQEATSGSGRLLFLGGEAGVGKTALLRQFCQAMPAAAEFAIGTCDPLSTPRPLGPLADMAVELGVDTETQVSDTQPRERLFRRVLERLGESTAPDVVVIEDAHWADDASLDLLRFLGRRLEALPRLMIVTYRNDEVGPSHPLRVVMGDLSTCSWLRRMNLPRLSAQAVEKLAADSALDATELHQRTGGNPFFVSEVLGAAIGSIPPTVRDAVLARASRLPAEARRALDACAVIGYRIDPDLLEEVVAGGPAAAEACVSHGMLCWTGTRLSFRHELAREVVLDALSPQSKQVYHEAALAALKQRDMQDFSRLAHHAEGAADAAAVLEYAPAAALRARSARAHREAAAQYDRSLRFADAISPAERADLLAAFADECLLTDQLENAIAARREAIDIHRRSGNRHAQSLALAQHALVLNGQGCDADAEQASREAIAVLDGLPACPEMAFAQMRAAYLRMLASDNQAAIDGGQKAIELARHFKDWRTLIPACNAVGSAMICSGDATQGRRYLRRSIRLARKAGLDNEAGVAYANLGSSQSEMYLFAHAVPDLEQGIAFCESRDVDSHRLYMTAWLALCHFYQGRWAEAEALAQTVLDQPQAAAISHVEAGTVLGRIQARRGDPMAIDTLDRALGLASRSETLQRLAPVRAARAEAAWLDGAMEKCRHEACAVFELALAHQHPWLIGELAYWRWKSGDLDIAPKLCAEPFALQIAGAPKRAAKAWQALGCPYESARALAESTDESALRSAHDTFEQLGARPAATRVSRQMHEFGIRGVPRGPRPSTRANPARLSTRELTVLTHMVQGLSNTEIAAALHRSSRTIDHHVSAILSKLKVANRTEAVLAAVQQGIVDSAGSPP